MMGAGEAVLLDTGVLVYATLEGDRRHRVAREVVEGRSRWVAGCRLCVGAQSLGELWASLTGRRVEPPDTPEVARRKIGALAGLAQLTVLAVDVAVVREAVRLCEQHHARRRRYHDMQLVALMRCHGIRRILTESEADFEGLEGIEVVNPFAEGE